MNARNRLRIAFIITSLIAALLLALAVFLALPRTTAPGQTSDALAEGPLLSQVQARGFLRCGIEGGLFGFSVIEGEPAFTEGADTFYASATGFDADFCRVVAVAVFGTAVERVFFARAETEQRFDMVRTGRVDLLMRNTTWTASRDALLGVDFGPVLYHDGQKFLAPLDSGIDSLAQLEGQSICVLPNTTTLDNLRTVLDERTLSYQLVTQRRPGEDFHDTEDVIEAYLRQKCTVMTGDESQLLARHVEIMNPDEHSLFPAQAISYEPFAPVVRENDSQWRDVVSYAVFATIYGEQLGIDSANVAQYDASAPLLVQQFLGLPQQDIVPSVGTSLGLEARFAQNIIEQVGNYGEIYARNLGSIIPARGPNQIWELNHDGRLFSPPWVSATNSVVQEP